MFQQINLPLTDKFNALSLRSSTNSSSFQQSSMPMNGLQMPKQQIIPPPTSPTAKRIAAEKRVRERRNAFKMGGKSRSLGNAEKNILSVLAPSSPPIRMPNLARRSESMNRHQLNPPPRNGMGGGQIRKSSDSIYGIGGGKRNNQIVPMDGGGDAISAPSQHIIQFCLDNSRGDLSARVLNRMAHKRPDFALFCANLGVELWTQLGDQFRQFLADVVANLASTEKIRQFSMAFGSAQVNWRSFGFKADFFAEMASALTTECVFLDGAAHPPTDAFEAWAELVELMFSAVRDGYYSQVRQLRRNHFSLGYSQSVMAKRDSSPEGPNLEEGPGITQDQKNLPQHKNNHQSDQKTKGIEEEEANSIVGSPRISLEPQEEFHQKIGQQIVESELTSTNPINRPSTSEKAETSNSSAAEGPSPSFGSLETERELGEEKTTKIEEREKNIDQEQNWHKQQNEVAQNGHHSLSHQQPKKTGQNWLAEMFRGGICQCLFGSNPSSSGETKDAQNPLEKKGSNGGQKDKREKQRIVRANDRAYNAQFEYADNFIRTSKYTLLTFIPCNLYQQFTRIANFYFLVLLFLQCIPQIASVHWMYTLFPLSFVLMCSAIKEGFDDLQRHRNDRQVNMRITYVIRNNRRLAVEEWMDVKVGDIIRMDNESFIAADLLLLSSSEPHGLCYIETAELDGETNLKTRAALPETAPLGDYLKEMSEFDGTVICEPPNNRLDQFEGRLEWKGKVIPLDNKNMLLRGCRLRNTRWCYGLVVFAGKDTKLMKNSGESPMKRTSLDKFLNLLILGIVLFLLAMCLICTLMTGFWEHIVGRHFRIFLPWDDAVPHMKNFSTIQLSSMSQSEEDEEVRTIAPSQVFFIAALQFFSYVIVLNTVVPISLYISVEMIRLAHSKFINNDLKMYDEKTDTPARARTSTLNEELGQVQYVFSDKTGTLTQNIMLFKKCSINGRSYGDLMTERGELLEIDEKITPTLDFSKNRWHEPNFRFYDKTLMEDTKRGLKEVHEFWRLLAICHTVMPERKPGNVLEYQAQSPDEAALTSAARNFGFVFKSRTPQTITVEVDGKEEIYEMLHILDFDNVRKRMSVLIRCKNGKIKLYCKGADTMIMERVSARETSELLKSATNQHLDKFATDGLRTLCVAYKNIEPEYCEQWMRRLKEARLDMANKEKRVDALYEEMEKDMLLLGATAIDDKLQDDVPQTIATLAAANIKLWVLTGDKTETAINIGYSCRLLTENMREVFIIDGKDEKEVEVQLKDIKRRIQSTKNNQSTIGASDFYLPPRTPIRELSPSRLESPHGHGQGGNVRFSAPSKSPPFEQTTTFPPNGMMNLLHAENGAAGGVRFSTPPMDGGENGQMGNGTEDFVGAEDGGYALVINGDSLGHALKRKYEKTFLEIGCSCASVICCRVTPLQKAQVVDLVKRNIKAVTLAIGDGANDVSMIRTAHIGVGISGQEGMQAVLSSDFSIAQFRYLERLLLVHGRWSYLRMCKFLRYFFYKNFAYTLTHFWYSFFCGFSAQTVFDPFLISLYNLCFTALPVLFMGIFDQDVSDTYSIRFPRLYIPGQFNLFFNMRIFIYSIIHGMISSLVLFFVPFGALFHAVNADGRDMNDYSLLAFTCFTALVLVVNGQIAFDTAYWSWWNWFVVIGSLGFYFLVVLIIYEFLPISWLYPYVAFSNVGLVGRATSNFSFWLSLLLICAILLLPVLGNRFFWFDTHPSYAQRLRVRHRLFGEDEIEPRAPSAKQPLASRTAMTRCQRRGSLRSGYAFSHSPGFGELIAKGTLFKNLENLRIPSFHRGQHLGDKIHPAKDPSPIRRFSLLKGPSTLLPSILLHPHNHHSDSNPSPQLLIPPSITDNGACSSVTQFSPGSSNVTTTTHLPANQPIGNAKKQILHSNINFPQHNRGRRGTVDSLIIEHPPTEIVKDSLITQIPVNEEEENQLETGRLGTNPAILVPLRVPSPDLRNTAHNLVINADLDEEKPLPTNWQYNPSDGTLIIPELEQPPQSGTSINNGGGGNSTKKTFISKKRRDMPHSDSASSSSSNGGNLQKQQQPPILAKPPPKPQRIHHQNRPQTTHGTFKGKLKKKSTELDENVTKTAVVEELKRRTEKAKEKKKTSFGVEKERKRPRK